MIPPDVLLHGYQLGIFPMGMDDGAIEWFSPNPRAILPLESFRIPHGLARTLRRKTFEVRIDTAFHEVISECAARSETWINAEMMQSYEQMYEIGYAHSIEAWQNDALAGGLYGVALGGAFFGESMFHRATDASKVALAGLVAHLRARRFVLLDAQWQTPHLRQFGTIEIPRRKYLHLLERAVSLDREF